MISFNELKDACFALNKYDKSVFNRGTGIDLIEKWEKDNRTMIPEELKNLLIQSDGFQILGRTAKVYSLSEIGYSCSGVPDKYVVFGELVGDGEKLCFHESTGEIVSVYNGDIKSYSIIAFFEYCLDQCLDGLFMSDADYSGLNDYIKNVMSNYKSERLSSINNVIMSVKQNADLMEKSRILFGLPVLIRAIVFSALENSECLKIIDFIRSHDEIRADNLLRGMRRRAIDNYFNRERSLLDNGKSTFPWNVAQMREIYNFDDEGMCYQNAGEVKKYDAAGNPVLESVKGRNGEIKMISQKIEIGFFNDIKVNVNLIGEMNNVIVKG